MKIRIVLYMICLISYASAQVLQQPNIPPLDAKNGINKFKLCSYLEIHKANLKEITDKKDSKIKWYTYANNDVPVIFEYKVKQINLGYYKNRLYQILVIFDEAQEIKTDDIKNKLELLFGPAKPLEKSGDKSKYTWETAKIYFCFEFNDKEIKLNTYSKILEKQIILDEL